ncbi:GNAT family N-acetyltransferase [Cedecea neteri]|uniref:GNAT family N-acetyltransferase n=1 Tax=Cedecea neteri TaxID=158822 RepID=UPI002892C219|nr:GNAT family N-acetyltransferase [Cedecea neteri]WNJ79718.1 GNAT family N-acetyltransferase [Cedecea neteri]
MKILRNINKNSFEKYNLDTPSSTGNIKILLLDSKSDFTNSSVKNLFKVPSENYPEFEKWYHDKLTKDSLDTIRKSNFHDKKNDIFSEYYQNQDHDLTNDVYFDLQNGRLVLVAAVNDQLAGVSVLKKSEDERKISTFFVENKYSKMGLARYLLNASLLILGNKNIDITVSENSIEKLYPFLVKNGFKEFDIVDGEYFKNKKEFHLKKY